MTVSSLQPIAQVRKEKESLAIQPTPRAAASGTKTSRSCCRIVLDVLVGIVQFIFYVIVFPALVMVGPAGLIYMLYMCYLENDVSLESM